MDEFRILLWIFGAGLIIFSAGLVFGMGIKRGMSGEWVIKKITVSEVGHADTSRK